MENPCNILAGIFSFVRAADINSIIKNGYTLSALPLWQIQSRREWLLWLFEHAATKVSNVN